MGDKCDNGEGNRVAVEYDNDGGADGDNNEGGGNGVRLAGARLCILPDFSRIPTESSKKAPSGKFWNEALEYNSTILVILVRSGWYFSMRLLHVEKTRTYSK